MNVSIHEDNLGALVLAKTLPTQFHPKANTTQSRLFGFVKKSPRAMFNYTRSTLSNNWVTSLKGLTRFAFEYLWKKIMGW